ncbi:MAG: TIGR01777 family protein [Deltaproteobacteria bacterium]|nr:TIGR01777 family protein [Deltaproteobacteria bacterium]
MKIVVTGATGFVGTPLVRALIARGHEVVAWTRDVSRARLQLPAQCALQSWDAHAPNDPAKLRGIDAIIHLAGESVAGSRWTAARKKEILASRVDSSRSLVDTLRVMAASDRPRALISASAIGFYGDRGDEVLTERSAAGEGFLADVCRAWESEVARAGALGVRTVAVRVGVVLGRDGGALGAMLPPFRLGGGGRIGSGRQWLSWIHLEDLVGLFVHAVESAQLSGVVNGVAPGAVTNARFTKELGRALGRPTILPVPKLALRLLLGEMSAILVASQRVSPERTLASGFAFRWPELGPALESLLADGAHELTFEQWVPRTPDEVFPFFADARNLEKITPDFLRFNVLKVTPETVGEGTTIDYKLVLRGIPLRWRSVIEEWVPGKKFVDRQLKGPYSLWHHTHEFEPADGGTILRDRVRFTVPIGALGDVVAGGFVMSDVRKIFAYRHERIAEIFGTASGRPSGNDGTEHGRAA